MPCPAALILSIAKPAAASTLRLPSIERATNGRPLEARRPRPANWRLPRASGATADAIDLHLQASHTDAAMAHGTDTGAETIRAVTANRGSIKSRTVCQEARTLRVQQSAESEDVAVLSRLGVVCAYRFANIAGVVDKFKFSCIHRTN